MHAHNQAQTADVVILGGGVIGMTTALALADAGRRVIVLEAGQLGQEASWAGGGIMSPLYPWRYPRALDTLLARSLALMPGLVERLCAGTQIDPELFATGMWVLGLSEVEQQEALAWANHQAWPIEQRGFGGVTQAPWATPDASVASGLWLPEVANIRNPRLLRGLAKLLEAHSAVTLYERTPVQSLKSESTAEGPVWCVGSAAETFRASSVVCAAGAWSSRLLDGAGITCPQVQPALGQMLLLKPKHQPCFNDAHFKGANTKGANTKGANTKGANANVLDAPCPMVLWDGRYIVPRRDGHILVGSTVEYCGFKKRWSAQAQEELQAFAEKVLGLSLNGQVTAHWSGLRPDAGQALPVIGEHPSQPGLWINTGHFRNGLVLALGSAELLVSQMLGEHLVGASPCARADVNDEAFAPVLASADKAIGATEPA